MARLLPRVVAFAPMLVALLVPSQAAADPISDLLRFEPPISLPLLVSEDTSTDPVHRVTHDNMGSWKIQEVGPTASVDFVSDTQGTLGNPCTTTGSPPFGTGSLRLFVADGADAAQLRSTRYHNTRLVDLDQLGYWACANYNNGQQWPYIILNIDLNGDAQWDSTNDDLIFFEPAYQNAGEGGSCGAISAQGPEVLHQWQQWDALRNFGGSFHACWWSLKFMTLFPPGFGIRPLLEYIAFVEATGNEPAIVNASGNRGGVRSVQGFSDSVPHEGFVDGFVVEKNGAAVTYDFDPQ